MPIDIISATVDGDSRANGDRFDSAPGVNRNRTRSGAGPNTAPHTTLTPTEAPGRITRKAREYEAAILELRAQGYTLAAICRTLAAAGIHVSPSTVRREANRQPSPAQNTSLRLHGAAHTSSPNESPVPLLATPKASAPRPLAALPSSRSAKDEAEAFVGTLITNPLVRAKEQP
ncbi:hypothetical protein [Roseateles sp.]|jgi:hypothetical protein|uniref:hypothetical protein n=1 Tax=Roseateles sp. TaxID=1971397 RepID=UPI0037CCBA9E